jgi:solute carrier family 12 sodium/potassium/chloride transporter 2
LFDEIIFFSFEIVLPDDDDDHEESEDEEKNEEFIASSPLRGNSKSPVPRRTNVLMLKNTILNKGALLTMDVFHPKRSSSTIIDVWWLFDDGGLTLLLPYLLRRRKRWRNCQFRIFSCVSGEKNDAERQHFSMAALLTKFRINYSDLHVLHGLGKPPNEYETEKFNQILQIWNQNNETYRITDSEYEANKDKIKRGLKLHEYLLEYSSKSTLIVV